MQNRVIIFQMGSEHVVDISVETNRRTLESLKKYNSCRLIKNRDTYFGCLGLPKETDAPAGKKWYEWVLAKKYTKLNVQPGLII